jgi:hypothetical protein
MFEPNSSTIMNLEELEFALSGTIVLPNEPGWDTARAAWNLTVNQMPVAVVFPSGAADIRSVVEFAAEAGFRVTAQATGHLASVLGDLSDTVLIRTTQLQEVSIDGDALLVRVGAGVTWGTVNTALTDSGLAALAGSSHDVGVVGYTLGGGSSWLSRSRGLASSSVTAIELVLANGEVVRATEDSHADLFWAVRGGGGNFGIVTALEFRVFRIADVYAGMMLYPVDRAREILSEYAAWTADLDDRATTCVRILRYPPLPELPEFIRGQSFVGLDGAIDAPDVDAVAMLDRFRSLGPAIDTFARVPTTSLTDIHMDPAFAVPAIGDGLAISTLDAEVIDALLASAGGDPTSPLLVVDIRHLGGALGKADPHGGAVDHLNGTHLVYAGGIAPFPAAVAAVTGAVNSVREALLPWASGQTYSNFREVRELPEHLWDPATLERLRAVKLTRDPGNLIRAAHELVTSPAGVIAQGGY